MDFPKKNIEKQIQELTFRIQELDNEIEKILMERINDKENRSVYDSMLAKRREEKAECTLKIESIKDMDATVRKRKLEFNQSIHMIEAVIADGGISDTQLRMLAEEICISEAKDGLHISIAFKARFATHFTTYDKNGDIELEEFESVVGGMYSESELMDMLDYIPEDVMQIY